MSFLAPKKANPIPAQVVPKVPVEAEVIRNPLNKAKGRPAGTVPSILSAGLAGQLGGKTTLGG